MLPSDRCPDRRRDLRSIDFPQILPLELLRHDQFLPWREILQRLTRGKYGHRRGWPVIPDLGTPWQDTISAERPGWRTRSGHIDADSVITVDYRICPDCRRGWVESPYTHPRYRRNGLAATTLAQLRRDHPGLTWHTLGGHFRDSQPFWSAVGAGVPGAATSSKPRART